MYSHEPIRLIGSWQTKTNLQTGIDALWRLQVSTRTHTLFPLLGLRVHARNCSTRQTTPRPIFARIGMQFITYNAVK